MVDLDADEDHPAAMAATPAARKRVVGVIVMFAPCRVGPWRSPRGCMQRKKRWGDSASPHDVIDDVTREGLEEPSFVGAAHRSCPGGHVELGEDALGVGAQRVERDVQLAGDLRPGELAVQKPEHLQFAIAQGAAV